MARLNFGSSVFTALRRLALLAAAAGAAGAAPLDFASAPLGPFGPEQLQAVSPWRVRWTEGFGEGESTGRTTLVSRADGDRALEVRYPAGAVGPREGGAQFMAELPPRDTYTLSYRVRFSADFDWVKGGKLPGLGGGSAPSGGYFDPDGFTARYMWRENGRLVVYLYWAGQRSSQRATGAQYAEDLPTGVTLERNRDYLLRQRVTLNTPGQADGRLEVWVDDVPVLERNDLRFRISADKTWQIDAFFFSTFHGGNDPSWAPSRDCAVQFADFRVEP